MEICIKWNMCRICLLEEQKPTKGEAVTGSRNEMQHLFNGDKKLVLHIYELFGVFMKPNDSLPDKICGKCISIINNAVRLRKTCRNSNNYLKFVVERTKSARNLFKPGIISCRASDDEIENDKIAIELERGHNDAENQNANVEDKSEQYSENLENIKNIERQKEFDEEISDNACGMLVELEEVIDISEGEDQMFAPTTEDYSDEETKAVYLEQDHAEVLNRNDKNKSPPTPHLQKFYMSSNLSKLKNPEDDMICTNNNDRNILEKSETNINDLKENNEELFHVLKDIKNEISNSNNSNGETEQHKELEFVAVEENADDNAMDTEIEELLMLEEKINDNENQAQVSSTVDTNDEIEYYEHNSNDSNIISESNEEESLLDQNFSNCGISSSKSSIEEPIRPNYHKKKVESKSTSEKQNKLVVFPKRKIKRIIMKSTAYPEKKLCVCEICGNQFTNRNLMNLHMKVHLKEKNHQCELCSKRFITACNLQAHMRIHTGEKPFECKYCGRRFSDRSSNLRHERIHTNEKPFECPNCGKCFSLATTLQNHMKVHTNERSYRCEPCGKSFKLPHHLKTHQNTSLHRSMARVGEGNEN